MHSPADANVFNVITIISCFILNCILLEKGADSAKEGIPLEQEMESNYKVINDSVHGHIKLHPLCIKIVDTVEFQRLRNIKQLGLASLVYPGACHTRFEHSLGVCHLARVMLDKLIENDNQWSKENRLLVGTNAITETEKLCVQIAALCHDLGHGPFSHTWERVVSKWNETWEHEMCSVDIFDAIALRFSEIFLDFGIKDEEKVFIKDLIRGLQVPDGNKYRKKEKLFLYEIVANKLNGIDVDKWDYLLRDKLHLNLNSNFDYFRVLEFCAVVKTEDGSFRIGFKGKEIDSLYDMFRMRDEFHKKAYQHRVVKNIETMYIDAFTSAGNNGYCVNGNKRLKLKHAHQCWESLVCLTDHITYDILYSSDDAVKEAKLIFTNVCKRHLYTFVGKCLLERSDFDQKTKLLLSKLEQKFPGIHRNFKISEINIDLGEFEKENPNIILYKKQMIIDKGFKAVLIKFSRNMLHNPIERCQNSKKQLLLFYDDTKGDGDTFSENMKSEAASLMENL